MLNRNKGKDGEPQQNDVTMATVATAAKSHMDFFPKISRESLWPTVFCHVWRVLVTRHGLHVCLPDTRLWPHMRGNFTRVTGCKNPAFFWFHDHIFFLSIVPSNGFDKIQTVFKWFWPPLEHHLSTKPNHLPPFEKIKWWQMVWNGENIKFDYLSTVCTTW